MSHFLCYRTFSSRAGPGHGTTGLWSSCPRGLGASGPRGFGASGPRGFGASGPRDFGASGLQGLRASRPVGLISGHQRVNIPNLWFTNLVYPSGGWARSVWDSE